MSQSNKNELVRQAVEPGPVSGNFYILVTNLPPNMNFSDLKTLARKAASVDKCFIDPQTCEGWVRVRNVRDFRKIYQYLNGLKHKGHTLCASDENETKAVYVWDQKKSRSPNSSSSLTSASPGGDGQASSPYTSGTPGPAYGQYSLDNGSSPPMDYNASCYGYDSGYGSGTSSQGYYYPAEQPAHFVTATTSNLATSIHMQSSGDGNSGDPGGDASWYAGCHSPGEFGTAYDPGHGHSYNYSGHSHEPSHAEYLVQDVPQPAKVIVKNLSRHATAKELETYLLKAVGGRHKLQEDIRFPKQPSTGSGSGSGSSSSSRQHAFLLFNTHNDALAAIKKLDKVKILGLAVEARLAKETVAPLYKSAAVSSSVVTIEAPPGTATSAEVSSFHMDNDATAIADANIGVDCTSVPPEFEGKEALSAEGKSHNLVVDGKSIYGHVKKAVEETKTRDRKHKHKK